MTFAIPDVDIDVKNRDMVVSLFETAVSASVVSKQDIVPHKTGVYFQNIPVDPISKLSAYPYDIAEELGYFKVDFISNHVYDELQSMDELDEILKRPVNWSWFTNSSFVKTLFHFGGMVDHKTWMADVVAVYQPESISDLAHLIALKLPAKKHLIGEPWETLREQMWVKDPMARPQFKKSHSFSYSMAVVVDAHLKAEKFFNQS